jgi:hypothetical protein
MRWFLGVLFAIALAACVDEGVAAAAPRLVVTVPPSGNLEMSFQSTATSTAATLANEPIAEKEDDNLPSADTISQWGSFIVGLGGLQGLGTFGLAGVAIQFIMLVYKTVAERQTGRQPSPAAKLSAVTGLSVGLGAPLMASLGGLDLGPAIIHSLTLAAVQVFGHELRTKVIKPPKEDKR